MLTIPGTRGLLPTMWMWETSKPYSLCLSGSVQPQEGIVVAAAGWTRVEIKGNKLASGGILPARKPNTI